MSGTALNRPSVRVPKTAELVANQIRRRIVTGQLHEGDALPSENALMEDFAISRPTLRAAFRARFCPYDDGHAAERVVRRVFLGEKPDAV